MYMHMHMHNKHTSIGKHLTTTPVLLTAIPNNWFTNTVHRYSEHQK